MKLTAFLCALVCLLSSISFAVPQGEDPYHVVQKTSQQIMTLLEKGDLTNTEQVQRDLSRILVPVVDFPTIARAVMGRYYKVATPEQQKAFSETLQQTILDLYAKILLNFVVESVEVEPGTVPETAKKAIVSMKVTGEDGSVYTMSYSMRVRGKQGWKVLNVVLDGINLGLTYRNQFQSAVTSAQNDIQYVIDHWGESMQVPEAKIGKKD